jgi:hypothetical protein
MFSSQVRDEYDVYAGTPGRTWYGKRRKPAVRKATPKGGYDRYRGYDAVDYVEPKPVKSVDFSMSALVLGASALVLAWWPILKYIGLVFAMIAVVMATRELSRFDPAARIRMKGEAAHAERWARTGRTLALVAVAVVIGNSLWGLKTAHDDKVKASGGGTAQVLDDAKVDFGLFTTGYNGVGQPIRSLPVTVKNRSGSTHSFDIQIEALNDKGQRVASDELLEQAMSPGETRDQALFQFVDDPTTNSLKTAHFRVAKAVEK